MPDPETHRILGEIKGKLDMMLEVQSAHGKKLDGINLRLNKVENKAAMNGMVTGSIAAVGVTLLRQKLGL